MDNTSMDIYGKRKEGTLYYSNDMNNIPVLKDLNKSEIKIFIAACYLYQQMYWKEYQRIKDGNAGEGPDTLLDIELPAAEFTFKQLQKLINYRCKDDDRFGDIVRDMREKLQSFAYERVYESSTSTKKDDVRMILFPTIRVYETKKLVRFGGNPDFIRILFGFTKNYTEIEIRQVLSLKHIYSIHCYRMLKQWRSTGCWMISMEKFKQIMGLGDSYKQSQMDQRVFGPVLKDLSPFFENLKMEKISDETKPGTPIKTLVFTFTPENKDEPSFSCPICGEPLYEKEINGNICWAHRDGWKDGADCSAIFNSVAEIRGYSETPQRDAEENKRLISEKLSGMFSMEEE